MSRKSKPELSAMSGITEAWDDVVETRTFLLAGLVIQITFFVVAFLMLSESEKVQMGLIMLCSSVQLTMLKIFLMLMREHRRRVRIYNWLATNRLIDVPATLSA